MTTDTKAMARWDIGYGGEFNTDPMMSEDQDGTFVLFTDHERVVANLTKNHKENLDSWLARGAEISRLRSALAASRAEVEGLRDGLSAIYQYGSDTLRGPSVGTLDDRVWQRQGVLEMTNRASRTLASGNWKEPENV